MKNRLQQKNRILIAGVTILGLLGSVFLLRAFPAAAASVSDLLKQQQQLNDQLKQASDAKATKQAQADTVKQQINSLSDQIDQAESALNTTETQITETEQTISDLQSQIKAQEEALANEKENLGKIVSSWYMDGETGLLDSLLGSKTLSDLAVAEQYYDSINQQILATQNQINIAKDKLTKQKEDQDKKNFDLLTLKDQQTSYKRNTEAQKQQKDYLLAATNKQVADYATQIQNIQGEITKVSDAIYAERAKNANNETYVYSTTAYPYSGSTPDIPDRWGFLTRECTSYVAWYWNDKLGKSWLRGDGPPGTGNAKNWPTLASQQGYSVSQVPKVGAIISWQGNLYTMPYGHVAIVEAINGNGTIDISEYNWNKYKYSYRENVNPSNYGGYSYIY